MDDDERQGDERDTDEQATVEPPADERPSEAPPPRRRRGPRSVAPLTPPDDEPSAAEPPDDTAAAEPPDTAAEPATSTTVVIDEATGQPADPDAVFTDTATPGGVRRTATRLIERTTIPEWRNPVQTLLLPAGVEVSAAAADALLTRLRDQQT